jgi:hypothetical protein
MNAPRGVPPQSVTVLPRAPEGWFRATTEILADGSLAVIWTDHDLLAAMRAGYPWLRGNPFELAPRTTAVLTRFDGTRLHEELRFRLRSPFLMIDRFPGGDWIVAEPRSGHGRPNARLFGAGGKLIGDIVLGDGIEHLQIDDAGGVWVGWFDEGIFGNEDWKWPGREWAPSSAGLACFERDGTLRWIFDSTAREFPHIDDCYALNIVGETAWTCYYSDFPVVRIEPGRTVEQWPAIASGARALAVHGKHVVLAGGYGGQADGFVLADLSARKPAVLAKGTLALARYPDRHMGILSARGDTIHQVLEDQWRRWSVAQIVAAAS